MNFEEQLDNKIINFYVFLRQIIPENNLTKLSELEDIKKKIF